MELSSNLLLFLPGSFTDIETGSEDEMTSKEEKNKKEFAKNAFALLDDD